MNIVLKTISSSLTLIAITFALFGASTLVQPQFANAQSFEEESIFPGGNTSENQAQSDITKKIFQTILGFLGILSLVTTLLGGVKLMTAGGNDDATSDATKLFATGIIGFALVASAWAIAMFVMRSLTESNL